MAGSAAEREIRDAVAVRARVLCTNARLIHELVVGGCRADLAAVSPDRLVLFELKSEKDTLVRAERQMTTFTATAHQAVLVAHRRFFDESPYEDGRPRLAAPDGLAVPSGAKLWCYPEPDTEPHLYRWNLPWRRSAEPAPRLLLDLLWRAELIEEAHRAGVIFSHRINMYDLVSLMAWSMTGKEIVEAVCRQLRARAFPEADAPISVKRTEGDGQ